jgi:hypothetical protein
MIGRELLQHARADRICDFPQRAKLDFESAVARGIATFQEVHVDGDDLNQRQQPVQVLGSKIVTGSDYGGAPVLQRIVKGVGQIFPPVLFGDLGESVALQFMRQNLAVLPTADGGCVGGALAGFFVDETRQ